MTQSILIIGNPQNLDIAYHSIDTADKFLKDIAHKLFTEEQLKSCWYIEGWIIHELFSKAQTQLFNGGKNRINNSWTVVDQNISIMPGDSIVVFR
jgi:hypothetical protein